MRTMTFEEIQAMYAKLAERLVDGTIHVVVEASYPLTQVAEALAHAKRESRGGKVQLRPNA
jgi:NADPH:quinone reductase-like Zn-dependent oxidoreductase